MSSMPACESALQLPGRCNPSSVLSDRRIPLGITRAGVLTSNSYVRGLERRVKELEQRLAASLTPQNSQNDQTSGPWDQEREVHLGDDLLSDNVANHSSPLQSMKDAVPDFNALPASPANVAAGQRTDNLAEELRLLSLEAAAERYLGSSSGLSFAQLTQTVLQRLSPDQDGFVFDGELPANGNQDQNWGTESDSSAHLNPIFFEMNPSLTSPLPLNSLFGNPVVEDLEDSMGLALLEPSHINYILDFYFAHSHTLYPIIRKNEFETVLWRIYADPLDPLAQSPSWQFRIWMVLAIGSTTYCSVSLMDETESVQFFNKAMTYFESAMGCGDLSLAVDAAEQQKRIFFSLYMMDRVVSLALGRPFAIQDDDITVEVGCDCPNRRPFVDVDDDHIKPGGIVSPSNLEPSTMAVPLHILALRRIASDIGSCVHSPNYSQRQSPEAREKTIQNLHKRLIEWRRGMPFPLPDLQSKVPHLCTSWFDLNYYTHVIMLYRPSPLSPDLDLARMKILAEASGMAIRQAINLHRQNRFAYNWLNLVAIFNSALSLMYTSTARADNLSLVLDHVRAIDDLELAIELLDAFGRKFPSAKKIQGMIQAVTAKLRVYNTMPSVGF
ncbi:uncharacterized protein N7459_010080 [Penicillium hispanicum]|uniref:uncharacterized protein n=1 Tax=Penicillium hispanicum TaxID=1080232 RepID=UPI0025410FA4|nr:uncharacterized protein N7459_010080 [Penicillium hispanicum]KAJ5566698.1 hypothetical protein N7459_010080 [Penicillium hispanicum]